MAKNSYSNQEKYFIRETLCSVLVGLIGKYTTIDLRNEAAIYGKISHVSGYMSIELTDCVFKNPKGEFFPFTEFFVKNRNIRYVHIPQYSTAEKLAEKGIESIKKQPKMVPTKKKVFKTKRAQRYQEEILKELGTQMKS